MDIVVQKHTITYCNHTKSIFALNEEEAKRYVQHNPTVESYETVWGRLDVADTTIRSMFSTFLLIVVACFHIIAFEPKRRIKNE